MVYVPSRNEARAALAEAVAVDNKRRQLGGDNGDDPVASFFSVIFGGGDDQPTTSTRRTTTTQRVNTPQPLLPTTTPVVITPTPLTPTTTRTTSTRPLSTAQVVTSMPPIVDNNPTPTSLVTVTSTAPDPANTGNNDTSQTTSGKSGLPSVVVGVIVAAAVIFGLIFIALIARKIFQSRRRSRRTTWARTSVIAPFEAPVTAEKALPPPPMETTEYPSYPAYPPAAMSYANNNPNVLPYSPAAPSSAGYPAPYPFGGNGNSNAAQNNPNAMFNSSSYTPADLAGPPPVVIQQTPPTPLTAAPATNAPISIVKRTFVPSLPDELSIANGDQVRVISAYDDGWALCEKVSSGERGVVPQECLEDVKTTSSNTPGQQLASGAGDSASRLNRASSLKRDQGQTY